MEARFGGPARAALFAAVLALVASVAVQPALPAGATAAGPLPACRYDDILTSPRQYTDWSETLVDTILRVPSSYAPPDLVSVSTAGVAGSGKVRSLLIPDLQALTEAAAAADATVGVLSAYRSYKNQQETFNYWVGALGRDAALRKSARPGHSEHQLGLAIDFRSEPGGSPFEGDWATTPAGAWMQAHAWEFGFVMSYPKNKLSVVCYDYEPWHYRYVGRDVARAVHDSGLTLREYLWRHFTTTVVPGKTHVPTKTPAAPGQSMPTPSPAITPPPSEPPVTLAPATPPATPTPAPSMTEPVSAAPGEPPTSPAGTTLQASVVAGLALALAAAAMVIGWMVLRRRGAP
jgi:zinc D-Ala-D-Ala carboxypeptidase